MINMSCLHPVVITTPQGQFNVPCRHCLNCRIAYTHALEFGCEHELNRVYHAGYGASFVSFTYSDDNVPSNFSLCKRDLQLFMKNVRRHFDYHKTGFKFKYVACGEYGDKYQRPHYHVVFFGLSDVQINSIASDCWDKGMSMSVFWVKAVYAMS